jgi:hypothetical protein
MVADFRFCGASEKRSGQSRAEEAIPRILHRFWRLPAPGFTVFRAL